MKLFASFSEAIREGAKLSPQVFGWLSRDGGTCALGAGLTVMGFEEPPNPMESFHAINRMLDDAFPYMTERCQRFCPISNASCEGEGEPLCLRELVKRGCVAFQFLAVNGAYARERVKKFSLI